jgi:hypothetical protein
MFFKYSVPAKASVLLLLVIVFACKKSPTTPAPPVTPGRTADTTITPGKDAAAANTIGFFLDDWQAKSFTAPAYTETAVPGAATSTVTVDATSIITKIPLAAFGHNAVWWMGTVAGDARIIEPITNLHPHIIRFPGGSSSDAYFWNAAQDVRPADAPAMLTDDAGIKKEPGYR